jgi:hypothetical protein
VLAKFTLGELVFVVFVSVEDVSAEVTDWAKTAELQAQRQMIKLLRLAVVIFVAVIFVDFIFAQVIFVGFILVGVNSVGVICVRVNSLGSIFVGVICAALV